MKESMSNIDIRMILPELQRAAEGAFIKNIYQYGQIFVLKLYKSGGESSQLLIQPGVRVHLTAFKRPAPRIPSKFASVLRKYLREKRIQSVRQHDLDRILILEIGDEQESHRLVAELFGQGNLLLIDPENRIFMAQHYRRMKDRDVVPKAEYVLPPPRGVDIFGLEEQSIESVLSESNASVVRTLSSRLNLDALSCEEICALAGVQSTRNIAELGETGMADLKMGIRRFGERLRRGIEKPRIVFDDDVEDSEEGSEPDAFLPFEFESFSDRRAKEFQSFSEAIDDFFSVSEAEQIAEEVEDPSSAERERLQKIIEKQSESISGLLAEAERSRREGELIYSHFQIVKDVLDTLSSARSSGLPWADIINRVDEGRAGGHEIAKRIEKIVPARAQVSVLLDGTVVRLDIRRTAQDNATLAYETAKKSENKAEGAKKQIERTKEALSKLSTVAPLPRSTATPIRVRKKRWYEKYRWCISSEGYLILGGRDAKSNEQLAKKQLSSNDVFLHASLHGAPYTVVKVPDVPPGEETLREAAQFAVTFSRAWQDGLSSGDAYWVAPEQVSFTPPTGEYLPTGAVMIYGTKNYIRNVPVELSVGVIIEDHEAVPVSGPPSSVGATTQYWVRIVPGTVKKSQLAKEVAWRLRSKLSEEEATLLDGIPQEDWMQVLPPGDGRIEA